jgi:hypothetical protein
MSLIRRIVSDDPVTLDLLDQAMGSRQGERTDLWDIVDNVNEVEDVGEEERPTGNTEQYALRRLRTSRPDLHAQVLAGSLTPHAAMVQATFDYAALPVETATELRRHWAGVDRRQGKGGAWAVWRMAFG